MNMNQKFESKAARKQALRQAKEAKKAEKRAKKEARMKEKARKREARLVQKQMRQALKSKRNVDKAAKLALRQEKRALREAKKQAIQSMKDGRLDTLPEIGCADAVESNGDPYLLVIDGNNMRGGGPGRLSRADIQKHLKAYIQANQQHLQDVCVLLMFDGSGPKQPTINTTFENGCVLKLMGSGKIEADDVIVDHLDAEIKQFARTIVVTSDRALSLRILDKAAEEKLNIKLMSSGTFQTLIGCKLERDGHGHGRSRCRNRRDSSSDGPSSSSQDDGDNEHKLSDDDGDGQSADPIPGSLEEQEEQEGMVIVPIGHNGDNSVNDGDVVIVSHHHLASEEPMDV